MKCIIVSYHFEPDNAVGALRVKRIADTMCMNGYSVFIHTYSPDLYRDYSGEVLKNKKSVASNTIIVNRAGAVITNIIQKFRFFFKNKSIKNQKSTNPIEGRIGRAAKFVIPDWQIITIVPIVFIDIFRIIRSGKADVVIASGPLFSAFIIAKILAKLNNSKLILDYRDPWSESDYRGGKENINHFIHSLEISMERWVSKSADLVITVSRGLKNMLVKNGLTNVKVAYNLLTNIEIGNEVPSVVPDWLTSDKFKIIYTGSLYSGRRDPSCLFRALSSFSDQDKSKIMLIFLGPDSHIAKQSFEKFKLHPIELIADNLPYKVARYAQSKSDILLLLNWESSDTDDYILTAKLFEYIAAKKRILAIGAAETSELIEIIYKSGCGTYIHPSLIGKYILNELGSSANFHNAKDVELDSVIDLPNWIEQLSK